MEKCEGRTMFQSINSDWEKVIVLNLMYHDYTNQWKLMTMLVTTKRHSMESEDLGPGCETGAFFRILENANFDRLVEAIYLSTF